MRAWQHLGVYLYPCTRRRCGDVRPEWREPRQNSWRESAAGHGFWADGVHSPMRSWGTRRAVEPDGSDESMACPNDSEFADMGTKPVGSPGNRGCDPGALRGNRGFFLEILKSWDEILGLNLNANRMSAVGTCPPSSGILSRTVGIRYSSE